jgi:hypothetical protein
MRLKRFFVLWVVLAVISSLVEGQIGPEKVVDNGNITTFISRGIDY